MRRRRQAGQALVMSAVALGIVLIGAVGLAVDTAQLYAHRQMAQAAADAAAQASILSIFNGTNVGDNAFATTTAYTHTCGTAEGTTPCWYARKNGFGGGSGDTVYVDIPSAADIGLDASVLSATDPVTLVRVTVTRAVPTTFLRLLGATPSSDIKASAVAAIVDVNSPIPILVTHPKLPHSLSTNGTTNIQICGGPTKSIQVNSVSPVAYDSPKAGGVIDLSKAGPADNGSCSTGTGADFGVFGGALANPGSILLGSTGNYMQPASVMRDPFETLPAPAAPVPLGSTTLIASPTDGCAYAKCKEYSPGRYPGGINETGSTPVIFKPGVYYMQGGGFTLKNVDGGGGLAANWDAMCVGCSHPDTGVGMVVYDTGASPGSTLTGGFQIDTNVRVTLRGSTKTTTNAKGQPVPAPPYYGILFWEDRAADAHTGNKAHSFGQGNGCFTLIGNIYATNPEGVMSAGAGDHYQEVDYNGTPCSNTVQQGNIIVSSLQIVGTTTIKMNLNAYAYLAVRRIALVQ